jgi:glycerol-3-phosphate dehydrogenase
MTMKRNPSAVSGKNYDLVVVGGGIFGVCAAWDASLRGLKVLLLERGDFSGGTSANCFKIVHGGIRYLQHADLVRVWESSRERRAFLRIAPHLVSPLPIAIPTYGHGIEGKEILIAGIRAYDLLTLGRNRGLGDPDQHIRPGWTLSREECLALFPGLRKEGLTGAVAFQDGQMYNPARLVISFLRSAIDAGADALNYAEAVNFLKEGDRISGVRVKDRLSGEEFDVRGRMVLNAAGPWAERLLEHGAGFSGSPELTFSRDACFVIARPLIKNYALAVQGMTKDPDAVFSRGGRHLFMVPWRHHTLIGVWHVVHKGGPDDWTVTEGDLQSFIDEFNGSYPGERLTLDDVSTWNAGLVLFGRNKPGAIDLSYGKRSMLIDHSTTNGIEGLVTMIGVRYTVARGVAEKAINLIFKKLGRPSPPCRTEEIPVWGGKIDKMSDFLKNAGEKNRQEVDGEVVASLVKNYGSEYRRVLGYLGRNPEWRTPAGQSDVIGAEIVHAVREEMAVKLADVVFRRTQMGSGNHPGRAALVTAAKIMASELGWDSKRTDLEVDEVSGNYPAPLRSNPPENNSGAMLSGLGRT